MHSFAQRLLIVGLLAISLVFALPSAHAEGCGLAILSATHPDSLATGQSFEIETKVSVTCSSGKDYVVVVVDVEELPSRAVLSTNAYLFPLATFVGQSNVVNATAPQWSANATLHNQLTAPPVASSWTLQVHGFLYLENSGSSGGAQQSPFTIQVGQAQATEQWSSISLVQNGGFEDGWAGWQETQGAGFIQISHKAAHGGASSLMMYMGGVPPPSKSVGPSMTITQTATVKTLRGLFVEAWAVGLVRLRVQVAGLIVDYDFGQGSTTMSFGCTGCRYGVDGASIVRKALTDSGCNGVWCSLARNVTADVRPYLTVSQYNSIFNRDRPVQVTLQIFLHQFPGTLPQPVTVTYVDDVQLLAYVP